MTQRQPQRRCRFLPYSLRRLTQLAMFVVFAAFTETAPRRSQRRLELHGGGEEEGNKQPRRVRGLEGRGRDRFGRRRGSEGGRACRRRTEFRRAHTVAEFS